MAIIRAGIRSWPRRITKETKYGVRKGMSTPGSHKTNTKGAS